MAGAVIKPGEVYEDCAYHPCLCMGATATTVWGISLIDGSQPRACELDACDVRPLSLEEAWHIKQHGPLKAADRASVPAGQRWWEARPKAG